MKNESLKNLDEICEAVMDEHGSIRSHGIDYSYHIRRQIEVCDRLGCTRVEIQAVLSKYSNELLVKIPTLKRRKND